ncbi:uncharacterized protein LOC129921525 [Episyrphus balteatus]|uniref:uncharacterized protein LOC129921525 n=1 Tax=Episyrphus balteatus TaxID=286459 RepID=UPI0024854BC4|nr:uncharacterized protein LOC129921525 [Episyrphus balteatus]
MLTTPKKKLGAVANSKRNSKDTTDTPKDTSDKRDSMVRVFENGTLEGAIQSATPLGAVAARESVTSLTRPLSCVSVAMSETVITSNNDDTKCDNSIEEEIEEEIILNESTALLESVITDSVLNHSGSDSNILESSIYSEVHLPAAPQQTTIDVLNTSTCSRESRQSKKSRRRSKKCNSLRTADAFASAFPPQYTAIFIDPSANPGGLHLSSSPIEQIAAAAAASPFVDRHHHQMMSAVPVSGHRSTPEANPVQRGCFRKWFSRPSLPFVIGILALGGVACTLGGIVLGSTGLIEHSTQYLSAALLMIGIGVSLLVISGAIWRLSIPDETDECPCFRHLETCRNCNSPYCNNRILPGGYHMYPEFQHRPPPPSYLTSLNECAVGLLFHRDMTNTLAQHPQFRINTPPPLYRSTNSLSVFVPVNSQMATTTSGSSQPTTENPDIPTTNMNVFESPVPKEMTYLELD